MSEKALDLQMQQPDLQQQIRFTDATPCLINVGHTRHTQTAPEAAIYSVLVVRVSELGSKKVNHFNDKKNIEVNQQQQDSKTHLNNLN